MASFERKLGRFLGSAVDDQIIAQETSDKLSYYAEHDFTHKGWLSLSGAMGSLGASVIGFGVILIIATNWHLFGDLTKISAFILLLGGSHVAGLFFAHKGYAKIANNCHYLGCVLFIAGVGLMAQIFHLHSQAGESFLLWSAMIAPLAVLLRNGKIALLSLVAFVIWGNMYLSYHDEWVAVGLFNIGISISAAVFGVLLRYKQSPLGGYFLVPGMAGLLLWMYFLGFSHNMGNFPSAMVDFSLPVLAVLPAFFVSGYLLLTYASRPLRYFLGLMGSAVVTMLCVSWLGSPSFEGVVFIENYAFGWTRTIYLLPMLISVSAWVTYFGFAFLGTIYGALSHKRWLLNTSIAFLGIGIFTRFLDLMGSMMNTGIMFIVCGIVLLGLGYGLEKWRRTLIAQH